MMGMAGPCPIAEVAQVASRAVVEPGRGSGPIGWRGISSCLLASGADAVFTSRLRSKAAPFLLPWRARQCSSI